MRKILLLSFLFIFFLFPSPAHAIADPTSVPNNKFGIHIFSEKDLEDAAKLVNSTEGDWGYVTIVIREAERDRDRWQKVFDHMRKLHLIPIVRVATKPNGENWDAPQEAEINNWVGFLNSLNWVIQNRYIVIGNEPNHAQEWGGRLDPAGYSVYLKEFSKKLKTASSDFFVLPAGLDPSSTNTKTTMSSAKFIKDMLLATPDVFDFVDGWASHPYPHASVSSYNQELALINKKLPVFITGTGWRTDIYNEDQISENLVNTYKNIWNDPKVVAITPFILDYINPPFHNYSWKKDEKTFYKFYEGVRQIPKITGKPVQIETGQIVGALAEPVMINGMDFVGAILAKNTGQAIWSKDTISIGSESQDFYLKSYSIKEIEPTKFGLIFFRASVNQSEGIYTNSLFITNSNNQKITNSFSVEGFFVNLGKDWISMVLGKAVRLVPGLTN